MGSTAAARRVQFEVVPESGARIGGLLSELPPDVQRQTFAISCQLVPQCAVGSWIGVNSPGETAHGAIVRALGWFEQEQPKARGRRLQRDDGYRSARDEPAEYRYICPTLRREAAMTGLVADGSRRQ